MKNKTNNNVVTRADIDRLEKSTKKDIQGLKSDIKKTEKNLRIEILKVEERVENIEESQKRTEATLNKISIQLDGFVGVVDDLRTDNIVGANQIRDHEKRISKLESRSQPA